MFSNRTEKTRQGCCAKNGAVLREKLLGKVKLVGKSKVLLFTVGSHTGFEVAVV